MLPSPANNTHFCFVETNNDFLCRSDTHQIGFCFWDVSLVSKPTNVRRFSQNVTEWVFVVFGGGGGLFFFPLGVYIQRLMLYFFIDAQIAKVLSQCYSTGQTA